MRRFYQKIEILLVLNQFLELGSMSGPELGLGLGQGHYDPLRPPYNPQSSFFRSMISNMQPGRRVSFADFKNNASQISKAVKKISIKGNESPKTKRNNVPKIDPIMVLQKYNQLQIRIVNLNNVSKMYNY